MLVISLTGVKQAEREIAALPLKSRAAIAAFAQHVYDSAQARADRHTKTGALVRSLYLRPYGDVGWEIGHDMQHAPYAVFVHWGTRPHRIAPKTRKVLRWPSGGAFVFARWVRHPGYNGDPWLLTATRDAIRDFDAIVRRSLHA